MSPMAQAGATRQDTQVVIVQVIFGYDQTYCYPN
jgi:hypothetical protein